MTDDEINKLLEQMESEFNGDPEHDVDVLIEWGDRYRDQPGLEQFMEKAAEHLFELLIQDDPGMPQKIFDDMVATADEDFEEACELIDQNQYEEAAIKLAILTEVVKYYPLDENFVWKDFTSYLEAMVYQDLFADQIGEREIRRHPMHPGPILFTYGNLLIEMGEPEDAIEPLDMAVSLNPVCPKYLFELGEAYKRVGNMEEAFNTALWTLNCATNNEELARCYRDMAFCLSEAGNQDDALMLYMLSLHFQPSPQAETEIVWIQKNYGITPKEYNYETIVKRCNEVEIPVGISETVKRNQELLEILNNMQPNDGEAE